MSVLDEMLDSFEKVIWRGKPNKKAMMLSAFGGIPFALFFFVIFLIILYAGVRAQFNSESIQIQNT